MQCIKSARHSRVLLAGIQWFKVWIPDKFYRIFRNDELTLLCCMENARHSRVLLAGI